MSRPTCRELIQIRFGKISSKGWRSARGLNGDGSCRDAWDDWWESPLRVTVAHWWEKTLADGLEEESGSCWARTMWTRPTQARGQRENKDKKRNFDDDKNFRVIALIPCCLKELNYVINDEGNAREYTHIHLHNILILNLTLFLNTNQATSIPKKTNHGPNSPQILPIGFLFSFWWWLELYDVFT